MLAAGIGWTFFLHYTSLEIDIRPTDNEIIDEITTLWMNSVKTGWHLNVKSKQVEIFSLRKQVICSEINQVYTL